MKTISDIKQEIGSVSEEIKQLIRSKEKKR